MRNERTVASMPEVEIDNYIICTSPGRGLVLRGNVTGHPRFRDGELVTTSTITGIYKNRVMTLNTIYILKGEPNPQGAF